MKEQINYTQAVQAYSNHCKRNGFIFQQPDQHLSDLDGGGEYWQLQNVRGELSKVHAMTGQILES